MQVKEIMQIKEIFKRNHTKMPFQIDKITEAVLKAMLSVKNGSPKDAEEIANKVCLSLNERRANIPNYVPNVEEIQDLVEQTLMKSEFLDVAKAYILYRNIQAKKDKEIFLKEELLSNLLSIQNSTNMFLLLDIHIGFIQSLILQAMFRILKHI